MQPTQQHTNRAALRAALLVCCCLFNHIKYIKKSQFCIYRTGKRVKMKSPKSKFKNLSHEDRCRKTDCHDYRYSRRAQHRQDSNGR